MAKTYRITFITKSAIGIILYELNAWHINQSEYNISDKEYVLYYCSANVVDVTTETLAPAMFKIEEEHA